MFSVGTTLDTAGLGHAALYQLAVEGTGAPTQRTRIATVDHPGAVAVGKSETIVDVDVIHRGLVLGNPAAGSGGVVLFGGGDIPLDGPAGLAVTSGRGSARGCAHAFAPDAGSASFGPVGN